jgi:hypothetical protein
MSIYERKWLDGWMDKPTKSLEPHGNVWAFVWFVILGSIARWSFRIIKNYGSSFSFLTVSPTELLNQTCVKKNEREREREWEGHS